MKEKESKIATIINAFTEPLPEGEKWYEDRLRICKSCPHNSDNKEESLTSFIKDIIHVGKSYCTLCGCFDDRKCSRKEEECPDKRWSKLAILTVGDSLDLELISGKGQVSLQTSSMDSYFQVDLGTVKLDSDTKTELLLKAKDTFHIASLSAGCPKCTTASFQNIDKNYKVSIDLKLREINKGNFVKTVYIKYLINE